jgi:hypothetical protein
MWDLPRSFQVRAVHLGMRAALLGEPMGAGGAGGVVPPHMAGAARAGRMPVQQSLNAWKRVELHADVLFETAV